VPPSESASEIVIVISRRIAGSAASSIYFDNLLVRPELSTCGHSKGGPAILFAMTKGKGDINKKSEVLQGTLDLMILKTLQAMGPLHGFGIARRLEQLSEEVLRLNEGTVYTSLLRLQQEGWIAAEWGASENNRKAKFYSITKRGLKQLARETEDWERISGVIDRLLRLEGQR
jgi:PadR family transcriptional regulator